MHVYTPPQKLTRDDLNNLNLQIDDSCPLGRAMASVSSSEKSPIKYLYANCKAFDDAIPQTARIITGRRGSGKSSFLKAIQLGCYYDLKISVAHREFVSWVNQSINNDYTQLSFEDIVEEIYYFFWLLVFNEIYGKHDTCEKIGKFLKKSNVKNGEIGVNSYLKTWASNNTGSKSALINITSGLITAFFQENKNNFLEAKQELSKLLIKKKVVILIDSPEEIDFENNFKHTIFSALVYASSTFQPDEVEIVPKYFVSAEYYQKLKSTSVNWDKVKPRIKALRWTPSELLIMLAKRLLFYEFYKTNEPSESLDFSGLKTANDAIDIIHRFATKEVHNKDRNIDEKTVQYLLRHTQLTPRQLIEQGNSIWSLELEKSGTLYANSHQIRIGISNQERQNAGEVFQSYKSLYPSAEIICNLAFSGKGQFIVYDDYLKINNELPESDDYRKYKQDPYYFRRMLHETGCLGIVINKDINNSEVYLLTRFENDVNDKLDVGGDHILVIHPMFVRVSGACISTHRPKITIDGVDFSNKPVCAKSAYLF